LHNSSIGRRVFGSHELICAVDLVACLRFCFSIKRL